MTYRECLPKASALASNPRNLDRRVYGKGGISDHPASRFFNGETVQLAETNCTKEGKDEIG
jgi:hypothetical protein